jgi:mycothiol synthase
VTERSITEKLARNEQNGHEMTDMRILALPEGYTVQPATMADLEMAVDLFNVCSMALEGVKDYDVERLADEWKQPGFDLAANTRMVFAADGQLVGYYEVVGRGTNVSLFPWGRIDPMHLDKGVGDYLLAWAEQRSRQMMAQAPPEARVVMISHPLALDTELRSLVERAGFRLVRHSLWMVIELAEKPAEAQWPAGITVRTVNVDQDLPALVTAVREAFRDHWGHVEAPFEQELERWRYRIGEDKELAPTLCWLAMDGEEIAGANLCRPRMSDDPAMGWVESISVRRPWRHRGLGLALLQHAFGEFYRRGQQRVGLAVDAQSLTGAVGLYERVGMRSDPKRQYCNYQKELRPGVDLRTQTVEA